MAYGDFTYPEVRERLKLRLAEQHLFASVVAIELNESFIETFHRGVELAIAIGSEKAKSEFIIAPLLLELKKRALQPFGLFSGVEFNVDATRGLNGFCDFLLTASTMQTLIAAPVVAIVEAKNDLLRNGFGQCIAAMTAARDFNAKAGEAARIIYGVVTTGAAWKFMQIDGDVVTLEPTEYYLADLNHIFAVLMTMVGGHGAATTA